MSGQRVLARVLIVAAAWMLAGFPNAAAAGLQKESASQIRALLDKGRHAEAETLARALLTEVEATAGRESVEAAQVLDLLVEAMRGKGGRGGAELKALAERAVRIKESRLAPFHVSLAPSLDNLANVLRDAGAVDRAKPLYERALRIRERELGSENAAVATSLLALAGLLRDAGDYKGAKPLYERALAIQEKALGPGHPEEASTLTGLGILLRRTKEYEKARPFLERALKIREGALGSDDPLVAQSLNNLANVLSDAGEYAKAQPLYERALAIQERNLDPADPEIAATHNNLANLLYKTGDLSGTKTHYERAESIWKKTLRDDHPQLVKVRKYLAELSASSSTGTRAPEKREPMAESPAVVPQWYQDYERGEEALKAQDWNGAVLQMTQAIGKNPKSGVQVRTHENNVVNYHPYLKLGIAYFNLGQYEAALRSFDTEEELGAIAGSSADLYNLHAFRRLAQEAARAAAQDKRAQAIVAKSLEEARALERKGRLDDAMAALGRGLAASPRNTELYTAMQRIRDLVAAQAKPESPQAREAEVSRLVKEGEALMKSGDYPRLVSVLNRVLALDPSNASALAYLQRAGAPPSAGFKLPPAIVLANSASAVVPSGGAETASTPEERVSSGALLLAGVVVDDQPEVKLTYRRDGDQVVGEEKLNGRKMGNLYSFNFARPLELAPGLATFTVVASDPDGLRAEAVHRVRYLRPWTRSPWFFSGLAVLAVALVGAVQGYRVRRRSRLLKRRFNPYVAGAPVLRDDLFLGREGLLSFVLQTIPNNSILLYGERRIGKTSLQHHLKKRLQQMNDPEYDFYPVYVDLQGTSQERFFATLGEEVFQQLSSILDGARPGRGLPDGAPYAYPTFVSDIQHVLKLLRARSKKKVKLVLLIDEVDELNAYDPKINQRLRSLFMKSFAEDLVAVVSGVGIKKQWTSEGSPWYNFFEEIQVKPFTPEDARELILRPIRGIFHVDEGVVDRIIAATDCKPYLIQKTCIALVNRLHEERRRRIRLDDVEAVGTAAEA